MRIRTIKPEFFEDERLALLSPHARLLFIGCWLLADKNGVLENRPAMIKARVFPYETGEASDASRLLPMLYQERFLVPFESGGKLYLWIPGFGKHQRLTGKEAQSDGKYPVPSLEIREGKHLGSIREASGAYPGAQEQGTGNREQGKDIPPTADADDKPTRKERNAKERQAYDEEFSKAWVQIVELTPNASKAPSAKAWATCRKDGISPEDILGWYRAFAQDKTERRFVTGFHRIAEPVTIRAWMRTTADGQLGDGQQEQRTGLSKEAIERAMAKMQANLEENARIHAENAAKRKAMEQQKATA